MLAMSKRQFRPVLVEYMEFTVNVALHQQQSLLWHLAFELTELFASGELTPQDMDGIMYEMHKAYFKYREQKREKERIMNL